MAVTIEKGENVNLSFSWGVSFSDYKVSGTPVDFQDLMIAVAERRAVIVEGEVTPLTGRVKQRNAALDALGQALADLSGVQAQFKNDDSGGTTRGSVSATTVSTITRYLNKTMPNPPSKSQTEYYIQLVKSKIDGLNNGSQTDMARLQSLVDRRDESFSTATTLMSSVSDTRGNLIRNL